MRSAPDSKCRCSVGLAGSVGAYAPKSVALGSAQAQGEKPARRHSGMAVEDEQEQCCEVTKIENKVKKRIQFAGVCLVLSARGHNSATEAETFLST